MVERENFEPIDVTPCAVETDFLYSRQYLVALRQKELMRLRVDKIMAVKIAKDIAEKNSPTNQKLRVMKKIFGANFARA